MIKSGREWPRRKTNSNVIKIRFTYNLWYEYLIRPHAMYNVYHPLKIWLFSQGAVLHSRDKISVPERYFSYRPNVYQCLLRVCRNNRKRFAVNNQRHHLRRIWFSNKTPGRNVLGYSGKRASEKKVVVLNIQSKISTFTFCLRISKNLLHHSIFHTQ